MRLNPTVRWLLLTALTLLLISGGAWWFLDEFQRAGAHWLLALHGGAAMASLLVIGAILGHHSLLSWRRKINRFSGAITLLTLGALIVTAFALYYTGSDALREQAVWLHTVAGAALPAVLALHAIIGRRILRRIETGSAIDQGGDI